MKLGLIKYNAGNTQSVIFALNRLGIEPVLTSSEEELRSCDKIIFPGVGEATNTMRHLKETGLHKVIPQFKQPLLGICLGMQLMCTHSEEGDTEGLGIFDVEVKKFVTDAPEKYKIPHMGWNTIGSTQGALFKGVENEHMYFVHSYYVPLTDDTAAVSDYILPFSAGLQKDNFYATQFHPEKSGSAGQQILKNFLEL